jgi:hypothetical protein
MQKYENPENVEDVICKLRNSPTLKDVDLVIKEVYPDWMVTVIDKYSSDYKSLTKTWEKTVMKAGVPQAKIIIVDYLPVVNDKKYSLILSLAEIFTQSGFMVRRKGDFMSCTKCLSVLPSKTLHSKMKNSVKIVPDVWSDHCTSC